MHSGYKHNREKLFIVIAGIIFYFVILRMDAIAKILGNVYRVVRPFVYGLIIAYLLSPICDFFERKLKKHVEPMIEKVIKKGKNSTTAISVALTMVLAILAIYGFFAMLIPELGKSIYQLWDALPEYGKAINTWITEYLRTNPHWAQYGSGEYFDRAIGKAEEIMREQGAPVVNALMVEVSGKVVSMVTIVASLGMGFVVAAYVLYHRKTFKRKVIMLTKAIFSKTQADWILRQAEVLNGYLLGFVKGKIIDSIIIGLICGVVTVSFQIPYAVIVSVVVGVTNIIPIFGPFIGAIPSAVLIFMASPVASLYFVVFIIILQQIDANIIGPKVLGSATNLSSFWILFSIIVFGGFWGVPGMVLGVPLFGFIYQLAGEWIHRRLAEKGVTV